jgi:hypothetical protein
MKIYMFRTVPQEFFTINTAMAYVLQFFGQLSSIRIRMESPDPVARKLSAKLYDKCHCCVYSEKLMMKDRGTVRNMYNFIPRINLRN